MAINVSCNIFDKLPKAVFEYIMNKFVGNPIEINNVGVACGKFLGYTAFNVTPSDAYDWIERTDNLSCILLDGAEFAYCIWWETDFETMSKLMRLIIDINLNKFYKWIISLNPDVLSVIFDIIGKIPLFYSNYLHYLYSSITSKHIIDKIEYSTNNHFYIHRGLYLRREFVDLFNYFNIIGSFAAPLYNRHGYNTITVIHEDLAHYHHYFTYDNITNGWYMINYVIEAINDSNINKEHLYVYLKSYFGTNIGRLSNRDIASVDYLCKLNYDKWTIDNINFLKSLMKPYR